MQIESKLSRFKMTYRYWKLKDKLQSIHRFPLINFGLICYTNCYIRVVSIQINEWITNNHWNNDETVKSDTKCKRKEIVFWFIYRTKFSDKKLQILFSTTKHIMRTFGASQSTNICRRRAWHAFIAWLPSLKIEQVIPAHRN
jgi:hypothetical protein